MDKEMHTATNYYLFNLAVSDLIVTLTLFLGALDSFEYGHWSCKVNIFFTLVLWNNSVLTITVLSVERYVAIWYPLRQKSLSVWRRVLKIITGIWIMAVVVTIPDIWSVNIVKTSHSLFCSIVPTPVARVINGVMGIVTFAVPLMIMTVVYIMIAIKVNVAQSSKSGSKVFNHRDDGRRVNKLVTLTLSFILCWLPYFVIRILIFALEIYQLLALVKWWSLLQRLMILNSSFSLVLNPILFSLISTKFKESLMKLWATKIKRRKIIITIV
ncbi:unnamed protein product, partial [Iphiclides podalirius]